MTDLAPLLKEFAPTGKLRASLNLGNPVLAHSHTAAAKPAGVTIDLSREFARELGVEVDFLQFDTAAKSVAALASGEADIGFMAIDPLRAETTHFTPAYVQIEGYYLVREDSPIRSNADVDRDGIRVVIGGGSAYGLYLQRHIQHATLVPVPTSEAVVDAMLKDGLDVASGVKQGLEADVRRIVGLRLLDERFMVINQAMAMPKGRSAAAAAFIDNFVARMKRNGFVAASLARHAITGAAVAAD
ncbi:MAG: ABC transporter substrate-binding protein [Haliea sp.]|nr:MAG: ABC transporter substrate-binding protein [Haliea sp.]